MHDTTIRPESAPRRLIIAGAGGLGAEAAWAAGASWTVLGFVDENEQLRGQKIEGHPVIGTPRNAAARYGSEGIWYLCAIGHNSSRARLAEALAQMGWLPAVLAHPSALVASSARIGAGTYIGAQAAIAPNARVGSHAIVNMHVSIGHDAVLGDFAHLAPGARASGGCRIGEYAFVGSNAAVLPGVGVGRGAVVGACSQVVRDVPPHATVAGVPARPIGAASLTGGSRPAPPALGLLRLNAVFQEVFDDPALEIDPQTSPSSIPDWDSVAQVKLVLAVEESFGIDLRNEELGNLRSAGDFLKVICRS